MKHILYTILLLSFVSSCTPNLEKALNTVTANETNARVANQKIKETYPLISAVSCAFWYPIQSRTEFVTDTVTQLITIQGDSIACPEPATVRDSRTVGKPKTVYVKCPDLTYSNTTILKQEKTIQENTAALHAKDLELNQRDKLIYDLEQQAKKKEEDSEAEIKELREGRNRYAIGFWAFVVVIGLAVAYKIFKPF